MKQYIGARYVPKFYVNPNTGDSTWLAGVPYEALTVVTIGNNSYTSKKPVPAGIGSPNTAPEYWVNTGNFNAQVQGLEDSINREITERTTADTALDAKINREITDRTTADTALDTRISNEITARTNADTALDTKINNEITARTNADTAIKDLLYNEKRFLENKRILIVGDSLSDENIEWSTTVNNVWAKHFRTAMAKYNATVTNMSVSSIGYVVTVNGQNIADIISGINPASYDTIILFAGINDFLGGVPIGRFGNRDNTTLHGSLTRIADKLRNTNCNVFMVSPVPCNANSENRISGYTLEMYRTAINVFAKALGFMFINGPCEHIGPYNISYWSPDNLHIGNNYTHFFNEHIISKIIAGGEAYKVNMEISNQTISGCAVRIWNIESLVYIQVGAQFTSEKALNLNTVPIIMTNHSPVFTNHAGELIKLLYEAPADNVQTPGGTLGIYGEFEDNRQVTVTVSGISQSLVYAKWWS